MRKILMATAVILTMGSNTYASDVEALTKAVVKIIQTQYSITKRITALEKRGVSKNTTNNSSEIKKIKNEMYSLKKKVSNLEKKPKAKSFSKSNSKKRKTTKEDKIISDYLR